MAERRKADLVRALLESLACRPSLPMGPPTAGVFEQSLGDNHFPVDFEPHRAATLPVLASIAKDEVEVGGLAVVFGIPGDGTFTGQVGIAAAVESPALVARTGIAGKVRRFGLFAYFHRLVH